MIKQPYYKHYKIYMSVYSSILLKTWILGYMHVLRKRIIEREREIIQAFLPSQRIIKSGTSVFLEIDVRFIKNSSRLKQASFRN